MFLLVVASLVVSFHSETLGILLTCSLWIMTLRRNRGKGSDLGAVTDRSRGTWENRLLWGIHIHWLRRSPKHQTGSLGQERMDTDKKKGN